MTRRHYGTQTIGVTLFCTLLVAACPKQPRPAPLLQPPRKAVHAFPPPSRSRATQAAAPHTSKPQKAAKRAPTIALHRVQSTDDLDRLGRIQPDEYRVHLIDVGTGLATLLQGPGFTMLFDGGSGDDKRGLSHDGNRDRLVAYLWAALGPSGPPECTPVGDNWALHTVGSEVAIDHVVLSHPHEDHGSLLDDVLRCYDVRNVWDSGALNDAGFYVDFLRSVAEEPGVKYHTASAPPRDRVLHVNRHAIKIPKAVTWTRFRDGDVADLGEKDRFIILHADGAKRRDPNQNSIVMRVELGGVSLLLTGDAESGQREPPSAAVGDVEKELLDEHRSMLDADILQVGHHGSKTSSRRTFIEAVHPQWALIGCGPKKYQTVVLPDAVIVKELTNIGAEVLRTDLHDKNGCPAPNKIGENDSRPGGCDNFVLVWHSP